MDPSIKPENANESAMNRNATTESTAAGSSQDVSALIESVLQQTQERFQTMSDHIIRRIDEMSKRVEELEKSITDLMHDAGVNVEGRDPTS